MFLDEKLLHNLVQGAAFLGSGGGGKISSGETFVKIILGYGSGVELLTHPVAAKDQQKLACILCDIGSISSFDPKQDHALDIAFKGLSASFSSLGKIEAFFPIEIGPENTLAPFVLAAKYKFPVVDGDGAARAVPTLPLSTFSIGHPKNWKPVAIASGRGDSMMVASGKVEDFDSLLRKVAQISPFDNSASLALWPDTIAALTKNCIEGTISKAVFCGMLLEGLQSRNQVQIREALPKVNELKGYLIKEGKLLYKRQVERGGFSFNTTKFQTDAGEIITVISQNENLMAFCDRIDVPIAIAPDSICYLRSDMKPFTNSEIDYTDSLTDQYFYIIGVEAHEKLHDPAIMKGFNEIIQELRFNTRFDIPKQAGKPLGDLIVELAQQNK